MKLKWKQNLTQVKNPQLMERQRKKITLYIDTSGYIRYDKIPRGHTLHVSGDTLNTKELNQLYQQYQARYTH